MTATQPALKATQQCFEAGFRSALKGEPADSCPFKNPLYRAAWLRGHQRGLELKARNGS